MHTAAPSPPTLELSSWRKFPPAAAAEHGKRSCTYVRVNDKRRTFVRTCTHAEEQPKLLFDSDGEMEKVYPHLKRRTWQEENA